MNSRGLKPAARHGHNGAPRLAPGGSTTINDSEGNFNADGEILIGKLGVIRLDPIGFDDLAFILINDNESGSYGNLGDHLRVVGCHAQGHSDLSICVEGDPRRWISLIQTGCPYPGVGYCCGGGVCP